MPFLRGYLDATQPPQERAQHVQGADLEHHCALGFGDRAGVHGGEPRGFQHARRGFRAEVEQVARRVQCVPKVPEQASLQGIHIGHFDVHGPARLQERVNLPQVSQRVVDMLQHIEERDGVEGFVRVRGVLKEGAVHLQPVMLPRDLAGVFVRLQAHGIQPTLSHLRREIAHRTAHIQHAPAGIVAHQGVQRALHAGVEIRAPALGRGRAPVARGVVVPDTLRVRPRADERQRA